MGRRRKTRKRLVTKKKSLPKIFVCPFCSSTSVTVKPDKKNGKVLVVCGVCNLRAELDYSPVKLNVDYYNNFVDLYHHGVIKPEKRVVAPVVSPYEHLERMVGEKSEEGVGGEDEGL